MNQTTSAFLRITVAAAGLFTLLACTSAPPAPTHALQAAETAITTADQAGVSDYAESDMNRARTTLAAARQAVQDKDMVLAKQLAEQSQIHVELASAKAEMIKAGKINAEMQKARAETSAAQRQSAEYRQQTRNLNASSTERGLVLARDQVLFTTGKSDLWSSATGNLDKLTTFLKKYPEHTVLIEGHTDTTGSASFNLGLSQRRADSVKTYLMNQGINTNRISTSGKGQVSPIASNQTTQGRQLNRRVEIIISDNVKQSATR
ncbi:OmpA family protein [Marinospirillum alkaliphilum]|uniref:Outer membrane protein OmpA n=1 Tax=Marinospirillum alkaliphilum DSM 21637 TaxID=1122209 RepID=A0A1K1YTK4_9GAMM|nr:OmpA family protein [Marinospirillum alkaliphilum]SFX65184.1 Outer membrane protein OmpA [Marinospirillum alkaliphilum DSM 21637]